MNHVELVDRAVRWLRNKKRCRVVVCERCIMTDEQPDAIGWMTNARSFLVECKSSRADFLRDQRKHWRRFPSNGMGNLRFYLTPPGLIQCVDLPEGWGLLETKGDVVRQIVDASWFADKNWHAEASLLVRCATPPELVKRQPELTPEQKEQRREERRQLRAERRDRDRRNRESLERLSARAFESSVR